MYIKNLHIGSFGSIEDRDIELGKGLNIIEGKNEAGKTTVAMFIKFMLYGLSGRTTGSDVSERARYVSWSSGRAEGSMTVISKGVGYKIERELYAAGQDSFRERVLVTDVLTGERVFKDQIPGVSLLGIPENIFINTVFVKQSGGKVDGSGLAEAIENILLSGDETLSTKKAWDRLDKSRRALRHKIGTEGELYDLEREEGALEKQLAEAKNKNGELIALECSVSDLRDTLEERESEAERCGQLIDAYNKLEKKRRLDEAREYAQALDEAEDRLTGYEQYGDASGAAADIARMKHDYDGVLKRIKEIRRRLDELDSRLPPPMGIDEEAELRGQVSGASSLKKSASVLRSFGILLIILGAGALASGFALAGMLHTTVRYAVLGSGALSLLFGVIFTVVSAVKSKKFKSLLNKWDVRSTERLEKVISQHIEAARSREDPQSDYGMTKHALEKAEAERWAVLEELRALCAVFADDTEDIDSFAKKASEHADQIAEETSMLQHTVSELRGKYQVAAASLDGDAERTDREAAEILSSSIGEEAAALSGDDAAQLMKRKSFSEGALPGLNSQLRDREGRLRELRVLAGNPAVIACKLDDVRRLRERGEERFGALVCALEALQKAGENLRRSLMPRIAEQSGAVIAELSGGKYDRLGVSRNFEISFESDGKTREAAYFSAGTADMAYISLRNALLRVLFDGDAPPTVYDESFARIDENRLSRILTMLNCGDTEAQSLVFTCRTLERNIAEELSGAEIITL